jgi:4-hydroxysphinganine ceramide fatty acyl 2-hydroxylase
MLTVKKEGKGRIFDTPVLEIFTKTNPALHVITYGSAICLFLYWSTTSPLTMALLFISGAFTWTLIEYLMHRFLFHIKPGKFQY